MKMFEEIRVWSGSRMREMCISLDRYTEGDTEEYMNMLNFVDTHEPTTENIYKVAVDIVNHSDLSSYGQSRDENIQSVMFDIANDVVILSYRRAER